MSLTHCLIKSNAEKIWDINFESALHTSRAFCRLCVNQKVVLFVSSIAGLEAFGAPVDYSTAKAAIIKALNMARKVATEARVNVLAPGNVYFEGGSWDEKNNKPDQVQHMINSHGSNETFWHTRRSG